MSGDKNRMTQNDAFSELCDLIDCLTLKLESGTVQKTLNLVAQRASEIVQNLSKVTESQFMQMSKPLARTAPIFIAWFANFSRSISMI